MELARMYREFVEADAEIIAVGPDRRADFERFFGEHRIPFPGIPDPDHAIAETYGQEVKWWKLGRLPAQFVIARRGIIRFAEYGGSMREITPPAQLLARVKEAEGAKGTCP